MYNTGSWRSMVNPMTTNGDCYGKPMVNYTCS